MQIFKFLWKKEKNLSKEKVFLLFLQQPGGVAEGAGGAGGEQGEVGRLWAGRG